jgi:C4-dicarboxylate transporter, DctM subunit
LITPPFAMNLFGLAGVVPVPMSTLYKGVVPFLMADIVNVALLVSVPVIITFVPDMMIIK